jgi:hypothetical protein
MMKLLEDMNEVELQHVMTTLARGVVSTAADLGVEKPLFVLLLFNDPKIGQYVANCERFDVVKALRETADRLEKRQDVERISFSKRR